MSTALLVLRMAAIIGRKADTASLTLEPIHPMDRGSLQGQIAFLGHQLLISNWWENCGAVGEDIVCSCGFKSSYFSGNGCWQQGHNGPQVEHQFDLLHEALYETARMWESSQ